MVMGTGGLVLWRAPAWLRARTAAHGALAMRAGVLMGTLIGSLMAAPMVGAQAQAQAQATTAPSPPAAPTAAPPIHLRIVGGLADMRQFIRHEQPFWTRELPRLSGGRLSAEIVGADRSGARVQDVLGLVQAGVLPFGTTMLSAGAAQDPGLIAVDLAGLNPDMASLRRSDAALRPALQAALRQRHGVELLALYSYPAQMLFCNRPLKALADVAGLRVRVSSVTQADFLEALGAQPVVTSFADIVPQLRRGNVDCAVTGSLSGYTLGLHQLTTHLHPMPLTWGLAMFVAHAGTWRALPADLRALLQRELARLEHAVWAESEHETADGVACATGVSSCPLGPPGRMSLVPASAADQPLRRHVLAETVIPRWRQRCGARCNSLWPQPLQPLLDTGFGR